MYRGDTVDAVIDLGEEVIATSNGQRSTSMVDCVIRLGRDFQHRWTVGASLKCLGVKDHLVEGRGAMLFVSDDGLYRYSNSDIEQVHQFGRIPSPVSLVRKSSDVLYVGLINYVVRLTKSTSGWHEEWLVPPPLESSGEQANEGTHPMKCPQRKNLASLGTLER